LADFEYSSFRWTVCPVCAGALETVDEEGSPRRHCPPCRRFFYDNPICVTMSVVTRGDAEVLLVRRGIEPRRGFWSLPGGFMEIGERPYEAALRELREETGLSPPAGLSLGVCAQESPTWGSLVVVGYRFPAPAQAPQAGSDCTDARYFPFHGLPELAFSSNEVFVARAREGYDVSDPG
jgi:ADP-ribose pyrophosphatase YjhB (NUDIX family)